MVAGAHGSRTHPGRRRPPRNGFEDRCRPSRMRFGRAKRCRFESGGGLLSPGWSLPDTAAANELVSKRFVRWIPGGSTSEHPRPTLLGPLALSSPQRMWFRWRRGRINLSQHHCFPSPIRTQPSPSWGSGASGTATDMSLAATRHRCTTQPLCTARHARPADAAGDGGEGTPSQHDVGAACPASRSAIQDSVSGIDGSITLRCPLPG